MSRLLLIEEDSGRRMILRSRLSEAGYEVAVAESGATGLVEARQSAPNFVLIQTRLTGGIEGREICRRIRAMPECAGSAIVLLDELEAGPEEVVRAYEAGCDAYATRNAMPALEQCLRALARHRQRIEDLCMPPRARTEAQRRATESEVAPGADHAAALRELASGRPDGVLIVDADGLVRHADRAACELLGTRIEGSHLGSLVPASGLEALVRDARSEGRDGLRFELPARRGRGPRTLVAVVAPLLLQPNQDGPALRVVLLQDALRRRLAAEALRTHEPGIPRAEAAALVEAAREIYGVGSLLGDSAAVQHLRTEVRRCVGQSEPVLLVGERGTGRARIARILHYSGPATGPFLVARCTAFSPETLELELFGTARGAGDRPGLLHLAQDGTLYLDEIGELTEPLQARLSAFLKEGRVVRNGTSRSEHLDVRIVASSSAPLGTAGRVLPELQRAFAASTLELPRLADRREDVPALAQALIHKYGAARGVQALSEAATAALCAHAWPGNLPELEAALERACAHAHGPIVGVDDLPRALRDLAPPGARDELVPRRAPAGSEPAGTHAVAGLPAREIVPQPRAAPGSRPWESLESQPVSLELYERMALMRAIAECGGDKLAAARLLGLGKSTLYRKLKKYDG